MRTEITAGQTSDYLGFDLVMADNLPEPSVLLADRGYDSDNIRKTMEVRDVVPVIPMRKTGSYGSPLTAGSTACAISLSGASTSSRMPVASPPGSRQDRRKLPGLHRHHVDPLMAPPFVNMT